MALEEPLHVPQPDRAHVVLTLDEARVRVPLGEHTDVALLVHHAAPAVEVALPALVQDDLALPVEARFVQPGEQTINLELTGKFR